MDEKRGILYMITPNEYGQWERWTQRVRDTTKKEMAQLRLQRTQATSSTSPAPSFWAEMHRRWLVVKQIIWGGLPVMEHWITALLVPHPESAEQTLAEVGARTPQQHAA